MRKLLVFNSITLDGYFTGAGGDLSWAHARRSEDPEWNAFVAGNAQRGNESGGALILGRVTYEMMAQYWPTEEAAQSNAEVAQGINATRKIVVSNTLTKTIWNNSVILKGDLASQIRALKGTEGPGLTVLGSGTIVAQLAEAGLVDEYQFVVVPVVIGKGRTLFEGVTHRIDLKRTASRTFNNGNVLLTYVPA